MKKITSLILTAMTVFTLFMLPCEVQATETGNIEWILDEEFDKLTVICSGDIPDYGVDENGLTTAPWAETFDKVGELVIEGNVTAIGKNAFRGFGYLSWVELPLSVKKIDDYAFYGIDSLNYTFDGSDVGANIFLNTYLEYIGDYAFADGKISRIELRDRLTYISPTAFSDSETDVYCCVEGSYADDYAKENNIEPNYINKIKCTWKNHNSETVEYYFPGDPLNIPKPDVWEGYTFKYWKRSSKTGAMASYDIFLDDDSTCPRADFYAKAFYEVSEKTDDNDSTDTVINISDDKTINYGDIVTIKASAENVPEECHLALYVNGVKAEDGSNTEVCCEYGAIKNNINYSVWVVDEKGNIQKDSDGNDIIKYGKIECNSGFFKKLVAFFKSLFKLLPEVEVKP